ncbi:MAG: C-GCAxxG-C-C family protein [Planctomycetaceae bacterium]|nr:C-GCAxxG-C-C family protein [Planctomycetaceae bacterium]
MKTLTRRDVLGLTGLTMCSTATAFTALGGSLMDLSFGEETETGKETGTDAPPTVAEGESRDSIAVWYFNNGACSSQAILATYGDLVGLPRETALKMGCGFSGGIGLTGEVCGLVVGATILLGLKNGPKNIEQREKYEYTVELAKQFIKDFKEKRKSVVCREIIQYDISTPLCYAKAHELDTFKVCYECLHTAVDLLENKYDIFDNRKNKKETVS